MVTDKLILTKDKFEINYSTYDNLRKDIVFLFHELVDEYIEYDLVYSRSYTLHYWEYLTFRDDLQNTNEGQEFYHDCQKDVDLIHYGCLIMILAMCSEKLSDCGCYINKFIKECSDKVAMLKPYNTNDTRLYNLLKVSLEQTNKYASTNDPKFSKTDILDKEWYWILKTFVQNYFDSKSKECDTLIKDYNSNFAAEKNC